MSSLPPPPAVQKFRAISGMAVTGPVPKVKKKRVVKKDPHRVRSQPWTEDELKRFRRLLHTEGVGKWKEKAEKLGTGRTAKSLHTRWLRDEGRIIDRPRGQAAVAAADTAAGAGAEAAGKGSRGARQRHVARAGQEHADEPPVSALSLAPLAPADPFAPGDRITPRTAFCANTLFSFRK